MKSNPITVLMDKETRPNAINIVPILKSIEKAHCVKFLVSWQGITITQGETVIYKDGDYQSIPAISEKEKDVYRLKIFAMLLWCLSNLPTELTEKNKAWLYDSRH